MTSDFDPDDGSARRVSAFDADLGRRVAVRRKSMGLSQQAVAERLGISFQQLQKYEQGRNRLSVARLCQLARILGLRPDGLLPLEDRRDASDDLGERLHAAFETLEAGHKQCVVDMVAALALNAAALRAGGGFRA